MNNLVKISEETIREIIAKFYNIRTDDVCLYHDYKFILKNGDKVRENFIYGIIEKQNNEVNRMDDVISRSDAIDDLRGKDPSQIWDTADIEVWVNALPSAQPESITVNIDHELTQDEYEKLRKDMANAPIMLLPSAQPELQRLVGRAVEEAKKDRINCAHCKRYDRHGHRCKWWNHGVSNVDWCSYAERRTDECNANI